MEDKLLSQYIDRIAIESFHENGFNNTSSSDWSLNNIRPINFFIGSNNSGKSRLIRSIYQNNIISVDSDKVNFDEFIKKINNNIEKIDDNQYSRSDPFDDSSLREEAKKKLKNINYKFKSEIRSTIDEFVQSAFIDPFDSEKQTHKEDEENLKNQIYLDLKEDICWKLIQKNEDIFNQIYIPILRGLRPLIKSDDIEHINEKLIDDESELYFEDLYLTRTINDYKIKDNTYHIDDTIRSITKNRKQCQSKIFTGYSIYEDLVELLLGGHETREKVSEYELYLSTNFFDSQKVTLTPKIDQDVVNIKIGDRPERPIYELGDGLQTVIIITFPIFTATSPTQFFIEEPETHLHAGLQRALIDALASKPEHQYFITTHSNHFIDLAQERNDVAIQRVYQEQQENGTFITYVDSLAKDTEILDTLGVRPSSVLLANCSIWVEGVTDKLYLRAYMKKYIDDLKIEDEAYKLSSFKENLHYIFTEYQGSNITHWYFGENENTDSETTSAPKLCAKAFLIADGDIQSKGSRVKELNNDLGDSFMLLNFKEIENYIPESILKDASKELWETFNSRENAEFTTDAIKQGDYANEVGIGSYLESFVTSHPTDRLFFKAKSGTIKDKVKLCRIAVRLMNEREDWELTPELTQICKRIYEHILRCNHG